MNQQDPRLLIDGYNLLFQSNLVGKGRGPKWLDVARARLITFLEQHLTPDICKTTQVVFDASSSGGRLQGSFSSAGIEITFANEHPEADDLLEYIIRRHSHPKNLRVVSSDQRIRRCARARRAESVDSESFIRQLESQPQGSARNAGLEQLSEEPQLSNTEVDYWLREFEGGS
ncbi:MAG: NYN domain-containing protein [Planctomycetales bacterium]|nr:NYN domain-containing protein [Planctomycetales bacterium]